MYRKFAYLATLTLLSACGLNTDPPEQTVWEARLFPSLAGSLLTGKAAAISTSAGTEVSIKLYDMEPNTPYIWHIRGNTCAEPGPIFGSMQEYPALSVGPEAEGEGSIDAFFQERLADGGSYHVSVTVHGDSAAILACGGLMQW